MKHIVIGAGEVGTSLYNVLKRHYKTSIRDIDTDVDGSFDVMHICFPYSKTFVKSVRDYNERYTPSLVIIHSTVPIGTTRGLGSRYVHSPIRGTHPKLERSIRTFTKFFGCEVEKNAKKAASIFRKMGVPTHVAEKPEDTELMKIISTTTFGWNIVLNKMVWDLCKKHQCDFHTVYSLETKTYNEGYKKLGQSQFIKQHLKYMEGEIGGHCVLQNCELLSSELTKLVKQLNKRYADTLL